MEQAISEVEMMLGLAELGRERVEAFSAQLLRLLSQPVDYDWSAEPISEEDRGGLARLCRVYRSGLLMLWRRSMATVAHVDDNHRRQAVDDAWQHFMSQSDPVALDGAFQQMVDTVLPEKSGYPDFWMTLSETGGRLLLLMAQCDLALYVSSGHAAADLNGDQSAGDGTATGFLSSYAHLVSHGAPEARNPSVHQTASSHLFGRISEVVTLFTRQNHEEEDTYTEGVGRYATDREKPSLVYLGLTQPAPEQSNALAAIQTFAHAQRRGLVGVDSDAEVVPIVCSLPLMGYWDRQPDDEDPE